MNAVVHVRNNHKTAVDVRSASGAFILLLAASYGNKSVLCSRTVRALWASRVQMKVQSNSDLCIRMCAASGTKHIVARRRRPSRIGGEMRKEAIGYQDYEHLCTRTRRLLSRLDNARRSHALRHVHERAKCTCTKQCINSGFELAATSNDSLFMKRARKRSSIVVGVRASFAHYC